MMKQLLLLLIVAVLFLLAGVFTVNMGQNAIVTNTLNKHESQYQPGIHFVWPLIEQIDYVYMNNREGMLTIPVDFGESGSVQVDILMNWHVVNSAKYLQLINKSNETGFNKLLTGVVVNVVHDYAESSSLIAFNQVTDLLPGPIPLNDLGVSLDKLTIANVGMLADRTDDGSQVQQVNSTQIQNTSSDAQTTTLDSSHDNANMMIESAYYAAQKIKTDAEIKQAALYSQIKKEDRKFYDYFRLIDVYKNSAISKADVPPFKQLYK